ncbi:LEAF RUST 10 DISEASE-RESISTANCE LOCUS RECEPTOR-LIKE PROTEIN KINASE-like 1.5 [Cucurbita pepo subsp. pepo]|uniref:LEAF RUST 10 DISEASE-RESISTANCE LOCUS RECEPTOR-LIKE PROTEIN KINASE-like 1.5 n=1 Tax=Cucurbita pepo subsp. pepo TaxID=3664 RepID=UPI000C9D4FB9|nr:LEAF RUST 10 DISEASE-RESISTANCE LOCUS RECEPTOR-LIKE PROTEIN KINASE-like 1.5 [Cucurbita pepo subsp. pepo]
MPSPPSSVTVSAVVLFLLHLSPLFSTADPSISPCPPFSSNPVFPFSSLPGHGHPSFQVRCSSPHSVLTINGISFSLLSFNTTSTTLLLSPLPHNATSTSHGSNHRCLSRFSSIPSRSINLSGSPFRISDGYCSRLSLLIPCSPPHLPNCSHCPWECSLIKKPLNLLHGCGVQHQSFLEQGCQGEVLEYLDRILRLGLEIEWDTDQDPFFIKCTDCKAKNGVCGFNSSDPDRHFICYHAQTRYTYPNRIAIFSSVFALMCLLLVVAVTTAFFRSRWLRSLAIEVDPTAQFLSRHRSPNLLPPVFPYEELESSTNRFDPKRKLGDGGFGSVYLGQLNDGRLVAVKYLHKHHAAAPSGRAFFTKSFCNEILILSSINHPNLVRLHGYCSDPRGLILVYDYVPNGTLADHLHGCNSLYRKGSLSWQVRIDIALQIAMAMEYLHFSVVPPIVHRDITSSNIFMEKDMRIKVGDFGLSRLLVFSDTTSASSGYVCTGPQGTPGYLDPDYHRSFRLTEKSDVYSFGVVLLELISGLKAVDQSRERREMTLADLVVSKIQMGQLHQVVDSVLGIDGEVINGVEAMAELAFRCVAADKDDRPNAKEIVEELRRIRNCCSRGGVRSSISN